MGLFGLIPDNEADKRAAEVRAGTVAPTRSERQRCWEARDGFFACLDANNIVDPLKNEKEANKACRAEHAKFEQDCAAQWVCNTHTHTHTPYLSLGIMVYLRMDGIDLLIGFFLLG